MPGEGLAKKKAVRRQPFLNVLQNWISIQDFVPGLGLPGFVAVG